MATARLAAWGLGMVMASLPACKGNEQPSDQQPTKPPVATKRCANGISEDPDRARMDAAKLAFDNKQYERARTLFDGLIRQYPKSSTLRVWRGEVALYDKQVPYAESAKKALPYYAEAEKLHEAGCALPQRDQYYLRLGRAYAYLRLDQPGPALRELDEAARRWDDSPEVHYHAARAHCLKQDVTACAASFERTLELAKALARPRFLRTHHSVEDWIQRSKQQSELGPLRRSADYQRIIGKARSGN